MKLLLGIFITFIFYSTVILGQSADQPAGDGTSDSPYQIATLNNLYWITQHSESWSSYFIQMSDIDASVTSTWNGGSGFPVIGSYSIDFTGNYDGLGHVISNLYIKGATVTGLFRNTGSPSVIKNLGLVNEEISGVGQTGGLIGNNGANTTVSNCFTTGTVSGTSTVGGLIGYSYTNALIENCYSTCTVNSDGGYDGGLVGHNNAGTIMNSYARGSVNGTSYVGGLVGANNGTVLNSYSTGLVFGTSDGVGGLVGYTYPNGPAVTNSFWDKQTSGQQTSSGGIAKVSIEMKVAPLYTNAGWDFMDETSNGSNNYWGINNAENDGYPFLSWQGYTNKPTPEGAGTLDNPYQISTVIDLYWLTQSPSAWGSGVCFIQTADIDASNSNTWDNNDGFTRIGNNTTNFSGTYDGKGHTISGIYVYRPDAYYYGLFGITGASSKIMNLGVINVNITGTNSIGALVGGNKGAVYNSYSTGAIHGDNFSGGLIGVSAGGIISNSYSTCSVSANLVPCGIAGLIGYCQNGANVSNSFAAGLLTGTGLLNGLNSGDNNFTITNCFWDTETTGTSTSAGGTGKTTAEMKTESTFTDAGWDFNTVWVINGTDNNGYPFLQTPNVPFIATVDVSSIETNSAQSGGDIIFEGGSSITAKGIVWDVSDNPTLSNHLGITDNGSGSASFTSSLSGLSETTIYYVRSYATNSDGTGYGAVKSFTTLMSPPSSMAFPGYCLSFDGTEDYASIQSQSSFDFTNAMTLEAWIKVSAFDKDWQAIITKGDGSWRLQRYGSTNNIDFGTTGLSNGDLQGTTNVNDGNWHHISAVFDGSTKYLYVDGELDASAAVTGSISTNNALVYLGENSENTGRYYGGLMDEVRIWNIARTQTEIQDNMNTELTGSENGLVAYYKFDNTSGNYFYDHTGNGNLGILHNMSSSNWVEDSNGALPVELTSFTANVNENKVVLNWETATEVNNYGFDIERSQKSEAGSQNENWEKVGFVIGSGNSNSPKEYSFTDSELPNAEKVYYRLKQIDNDGTFVYSKEVTVDLLSKPRMKDGLPTEFGLLQNYPNPFNPATTIKFCIPEEVNVVLKIYNSLGQVIETLVNERMQPGYYTVKLDGSKLSSGIYIYKIQAGSYTSVKKIMLVK